MERVYQRTFALLKPGVLQRRLVGTVLSRIEAKGLKIIGMKLLWLTREQCKVQYGEHEGKYFYPPLLEYMTSGPVIALVLAGYDAVKTLRQLAGPTDPAQAPPGTIRGDYGTLTRYNIIHASDSEESAEREISLYFQEEELHDWEDGNTYWYGGAR
ncbi:MAG: nucleoside-diphosphate kinase [Spirochaetes bacterium]|nr:nucleoside-diphosphate kinase [Spirochaetota bacterium]